MKNFVLDVYFDNADQKCSFSTCSISLLLKFLSAISDSDDFEECRSVFEEDSLYET